MTGDAQFLWLCLPSVRCIYITVSQVFKEAYWMVSRSFVVQTELSFIRLFLA